VRRGVSFWELSLCAILLCLVGVPLVYLWVVSRRAHAPTPMTLLAWHAAREEIEDTRVLVRASALDPRRLAHDLRAVNGPVLGRLAPLLPPEAAREPALCYPHQEGRIFTRLVIEAGKDPRFFPAVLEVRWEEGAAEGQERIPFLLIRSRGVAR
jgi:hypothetical protein